MREVPILATVTMAFLSLTLLDGCVTRERVVYRRPPPPVVVTSAPAPAEVVVTQAPPPLQPETIVVAPGPGYIWIHGDWVWRRQWVWVPGHWSYPPRPGARWRASRCEIRNGVRVYVRGGWVF